MTRGCRTPANQRFLAPALHPSHLVHAIGWNTLDGIVGWTKATGHGIHATNQHSSEILMPSRRAIDHRLSVIRNLAMYCVLAILAVMLLGCYRAGAALVPNDNEAHDQWYSLSHGGVERRYLVHTPAGWDGHQPLPVVLAFHGGGGRAEMQRTQSGLNAKSDKHGFLLVYPDGTGPKVRRPGQGKVGVLTWNAGLCCGSAVRERTDDIAYVRALLDELPRRFAIDATRIYVTGMSNGAMMAHRIGVELADRVAAIAPVAGAIMIEDLGFLPSRPVPILYFHGRKDPSARFDGGPGRIDKTVHRSVLETVNWWIQANGCSAVPSTVENHGDYILRRFKPSLGRTGAEVSFVLLPEGGHTWPGGIDVTAGKGTGALITSVDASEMMWQFFARHRLGSSPANAKGSDQ